MFIYALTNIIFVQYNFVHWWQWKLSIVWCINLHRHNNIMLYIIMRMILNLDLAVFKCSLLSYIKSLFRIGILWRLEIHGNALIFAEVNKCFIWQDDDLKHTNWISSVCDEFSAFYSYLGDHLSSQMWRGLGLHLLHKNTFKIFYGNILYAYINDIRSHFQYFCWLWMNTVDN